MRRTKIICTIGPASQSEEKLRELMLAGMNVARFNFSHGDHAEQNGKLDAVRKVSKELGLPVAALLDTKGPEIRLRDFANKKEELVAGQKFTLTTEEIMGTNEKVTVSYKGLVNDVKAGGTILLDDGLIELRVDEVTATDIICTVMNGGPISNHKGVNVPGTSLTMPYLSEQDRADILNGIEKGYDIIAASFVRNKEDVLEIRKLLNEHNCKMQIISKIENMEGINNLDDILEVSDGIMVARGDMGVEIPLEDVPVIQKMLIQRANAKGKLVVTATQMLESMMKNPRPTRAETTDIANAIYDGTSAIMLSGESANGMYPVEAVKTMAKIAERTERDINYKKRLRKREDIYANDVPTAISHATCTIAADLDAAAIVTVTMSGFTSSQISRYKPNCPIVGCTVSDMVWRQMNLQWGVTPLLLEKANDAEALFDAAVKAAKETGIVKTGDKVVITAGVPLGVSGTTNQIRVVEA